METLKRRFFYRVSYTDRGYTFHRQLAGLNLSDVLDLALKIYLMNWDKDPDVIEIKRTNNYSYS